jgi:pimeloyl-ACP methyl ester carboxylesterase
LIPWNEVNSSTTPPLLILHGLLGSGRNWRGVAEALSASRRVLAPDLPGHGDNTDALPLNMPGLAESVAALLEQENIPQADLLGHSLGGKAAMWLALTRPERVRRLVVVDIAPVAYPEHQAGFAHLLDSLQSLNLEALPSRAEADARLAAAIQEASLRQFLLQNLIYRDGRYFWRVDLARLRAVLPELVDFPNAEGLPPFTGPTLFLGGARSAYLLPLHVPLIRKLFPRAKILHLADAGHWPHVEQPEAFLAAVQKFLA